MPWLDRAGKVRLVTEDFSLKDLLGLARRASPSTHDHDPIIVILCLVIPAKIPVLVLFLSSTFSRWTTFDLMLAGSPALDQSQVCRDNRPRCQQVPLRHASVTGWFCGTIPVSLTSTCWLKQVAWYLLCSIAASSDGQHYGDGKEMKRIQLVGRPMSQPYLRVSERQHWRDGNSARPRSCRKGCRKKAFHPISRAVDAKGLC